MAKLRGVAYLFFDKHEPDCEKAAAILSERGIAFTHVASLGLAGPQVVIGIHRFVGLDAIRRLVEGREKVAV